VPHSNGTNPRIFVSKVEEKKVFNRRVKGGGKGEILNFTHISFLQSKVKSSK